MAYPAWMTQADFDIRFGWGPEAIEIFGAQVQTIVLVDVLRFTTALDVAVSRGARVFPAPWPLSPDIGHGDREVADGNGPRQLSLSPPSLVVLGVGDVIVLPSPNGSHCSALAATHHRQVIGGCMRNATAVANWLLSSAPVWPVAVVACGERWPQGTLRPAIEDELGAGALIAALMEVAPQATAAPEAHLAAQAFLTASRDLTGVLASSMSGRALSGKGREEDVAWAADVDASRSVPQLADDGAYVDAAGAGRA
ncbi:MAG TPA: 2-phosphosulfolactate phosphatase [Acidimicrobiales bacterium]